MCRCACHLRFARGPEVQKVARPRRLQRETSGAVTAGARGALIGGGIGAAAGTSTAFFTGKKDVTFGNERQLRFRVNQDVSLFG